MSKPVLYDYWRSSASYRVRIALNLLKIDYEAVPVDLLAAEHKGAAHLKRNPQGFVPALEIDGLMLTQSLAMIEYLDETRAGSLMPDEPAERARARMLAFAIAMEIHPVCNPSVVSHVLELSHSAHLPLSLRWSYEYAYKEVADIDEHKTIILTWGERWLIPDTVIETHIKDSLGDFQSP